jgi:hypothetical protein
MALQGSSPNLQGSLYNPQKTANIKTVQNAAGSIPLYSNAGLSLASKSANKSASSVNQSTAEWQRLQAETARLLASPNSQQQAYAPILDVTSINAQARKAAEKAVNPYYTKLLNQFVTQQKTQKAQQTKQYQMNVENLQQELQNTLQGNEISGARTTQDVATNVQQLGQQEEQMQQDTGTQFEQDRLQQAKELAAGGMAQSGLGKQQQTQTVTQRNISEQRQTQQIEQQKQQQELFKSRTFEDLARSGELATQTKVKGEKQGKFDLDTYIQNQGYELTNKKQDLESERISKVISESSNRAKIAVNKWISSISNPAQRQAALEAYGGMF